MSTTESEIMTSSGKFKRNIMLTVREYEGLSLLARAAEIKMPEVASVLAEKLERTSVLADSHSGQSICIGSSVKFRDNATGRVQTVMLVYPGDADISRGRVSILTPIGAALVGLDAGDSIDWEARTGELRRLTVLEVREPQPS